MKAMHANRTLRAFKYSNVPGTAHPLNCLHCNELTDTHSAAELAALTGVHVTNARRWKRAKRLPPLVCRLLTVTAIGDLSAIAPEWNGWYLRGGRLYGPDELNFAPNEVLALPFLRMQLQAHTVRERFARQGDWIEQRYTAPDEYRAPDPPASPEALPIPPKPLEPGELIDLADPKRRKRA